MSDPVKGQPIHVGNKTLTIKFSYKAFRIAQKRYGGEPVRSIIRRIDVDETCELAAAGLFHADKSITADTVEKWLEDGLVSYRKLQLAVVLAVGEGYQRMYPKGEAEAAAADMAAAVKQMEHMTGAIDTPTPMPTTESLTTDGPTSAG